MTELNKFKKKFSDLVLRFTLSRAGALNLSPKEKIYLIYLTYCGLVDYVRTEEVSEVSGMFVHFMSGKKINLHFYYSSFVVVRKYIKPD